MNRARQRLADGLWLLLLVGIPITSFPLLAERMGNVTVSPFSLLPLALLVPLWLLPDLWKGGRLPILIWPLLGFALAALLSAGVAWFLPLQPVKGQTVLGREVRSLVTLAIGLAFYLCAVRFPRTELRWKLTLGGIYLGGILALAWASVQADYILEGLNNVPQELNEFHRMFSIRDLERNRVTGFAFEPSWLGDQIVVLYLPLWLGAVLSGRSLLRWNKGPISLELGLLAWCGWILVMTRSRVSVGSLLVVLGVLLVTALWKMGGRVAGWAADYREALRTRATSWALRLVFIMVGLGLLAGLAYLLLLRAAEVDWRMRRVLSLRTDLPAIGAQYPYSAAYEVANRFAFAERLVYWRASLKPYERYPLTGVGPGNAGFLFEEGVPGYGHDLVEIRAYLEASTPNFPNPKNLWIRLLSESGVIGFAFYGSWLILLLRFSRALLGSEAAGVRWLGLAGLVSVIIQGVEGFSLDTFALPQLWIINGLVTTLALSPGRHRDRAPSPDRSGGEHAKIAPS